MKRFVQAACVAGAVILSAAGCCSSCGKNSASAAPCPPGQCPPGQPVAPGVGTPVGGVPVGSANRGMPTRGMTPTHGAATVGDLPAGYKMPN